MKKLGWAILICVLCFVVWRASMRMRAGFVAEQNWIEFVDWDAERSAQLKQEVAKRARFKVVFDRIIHALAHQGLSLKTACDRIRDSAREYYPRYLGFVEYAFECSHPGERADSLIVKIATILVDSFRNDSDNVCAELLERLERELQELANEETVSSLPSS
ncbi:MAG: hypothetical protein L0215_10130 [Gemmataceae bacterium]|nr:hypothetical protein [Gemmataceae bacterium]